MAKKYVVELSAEERAELQRLLGRGKAGVRRVNRARILLLADEDMIDAEIARALHLGTATVQRTRRRFVEGGVDWALRERPRPGKPRKLNGKQEAFLVALACSAPPEGHVRWTMQLLADKLVEVGVVDSIVGETVRRILKKTTSSRGRGSSGASPR